MFFIKIILFIIFIWILPTVTILFTIGNFISKDFSETFLNYSLWIGLFIDIVLWGIAINIESKNKEIFYIKKYNFFSGKKLDYPVFKPYFLTFLIYFDYKNNPEKYLPKTSN